MIDAREYLKSFQYNDARIRLKAKQLQALRDRLMSISVPINKEQVSHTENISVMSETVSLIVDMEKEIDHQTTMLMEAKREAYQILDQIRPDHAALLMDRYLEGKKSYEICETFYISDRHLRRLINVAINELQEVLNRKE